MHYKLWLPIFISETSVKTGSNGFFQIILRNFLPLKYCKLNYVLYRIFYGFLYHKPTLDAERTLFTCSFKQPACVSYPKMFYAVFMDFPNKGFSNPVAFNFRKMQNNSLSLKRVPLNAFDGLRNLKEM